MKLTFEDTKQAFEKAIKTVGIEEFKRTSMFMRNDLRQPAALPSELAA